MTDTIGACEPSRVMARCASEVLSGTVLYCANVLFCYARNNSHRHCRELEGRHSLSLSLDVTSSSQALCRPEAVFVGLTILSAESPGSAGVQSISSVVACAGVLAFVGQRGTAFTDGSRRQGDRSLFLYIY